MYCIRKKTFSRRSRKPPNPCPTHTQRHRSPCENDHDQDRVLDLCFGMGQTRGFFNLTLKIRSHWESNPGPKECRQVPLTNWTRGRQGYI